jgi:hypothetical protein
MENFDLRKYLAENKLVKENINLDDALDKFENLEAEYSSNPSIEGIQEIGNFIDFLRERHPNGVGYEVDLDSEFTAFDESDYEPSYKTHVDIQNFIDFLSEFGKQTFSENKLVKEVADKRPTELEKAKYTDKEMLTRTTANQFPANFTILDIIERYKEYVVGYLRSEGELNENTQFPDTSLTNALKIHFQVAYEKGLEAQPEDDYDSFDRKYWKNNELDIKDTIKKYFRFSQK